MEKLKPSQDFISTTSTTSFDITLFGVLIVFLIFLIVAFLFYRNKKTS